MATSVEYKVLIDGNAADRKLYNMIESIVVEQGIDLASEARIDLELCADDQGKWRGTDEEHAKAWRRIRIELKNGKSGWVPLIEGPIVERGSTASSEPGQSMMTLIVRDDSVYLNQQATVEVFEDQSDNDVAKKLFKKGPITDVKMDTIPDRPADRRQQHVQCCTEIELLRQIAEPYDLHVYVKPGEQAGASVGYMKRIEPDKKASLPALVLTGSDRNIESFHVRDQFGEAATQTLGQLDIDGMKVAKTTSKWTQVDLADSKSAVEDPKKLGNEIIRPFIAAFHVIEEIAKAMQQKRSLTVVATGSTRGGCYTGVLTPFDVVETGGVDQKLCTKWVIKEVTHTLGRSEYWQEFTLMTNAFAATRDATSVPGPEVI
jgi:hypothetical protein